MHETFVPDDFAVTALMTFTLNKDRSLGFTEYGSLTHWVKHCVPVFNRPYSMLFPPRFYILSLRGDTIITRDFRGDVVKGTAEIFFRKATAIW